jgi:valyl-tRNA synthetase
LWDDFCDLYLELKKLEADWSYAYVVYESALRLLHPLMPFITEELWHRLENPGKSIALALYPQADPTAADEKAEYEIGVLYEIITHIRQRRADNKIDKSQTQSVEINWPSPEYEVIDANQNAIARLTNGTLTLNKIASYPGSITLNIPIDRERLAKEITELEKVIANSQRQLSNEAFIAKAPEKIVAGMRQKQAEYEAQVAKLRAAL